MFYNDHHCLDLFFIKNHFCLFEHLIVLIVIVIQAQVYQLIC